MSDTIFPSVGIYAGLLLNLSFVCRVLKFVSSLAFCSTRGGLCLRRYVLYSSNFFWQPARELSVCRFASHGIVRRIHSSRSEAKRSYSSIRRSFSWFTFNTLQILLAAVSAYNKKILIYPSLIKTIFFVYIYICVWNLESLFSSRTIRKMHAFVNI